MTEPRKTSRSQLFLYGRSTTKAGRGSVMRRIGSSANSPTSTNAPNVHERFQHRTPLPNRLIAEPPQPLVELVGVSLQNRVRIKQSTCHALSECLGRVSLAHPHVGHDSRRLSDTGIDLELAEPCELKQFDERSCADLIQDY